MKAVIQEQPWNFDSKVVPMPWRSGEEDAIKTKLSSGGLSLGLYQCDGNVSSGRLPLLSTMGSESNASIGRSSPAYSASFEDGGGQTEGRRP